MSRMSLVPYRDCAMTPGTCDNASSSPNPLTARSSGALILVIASGVVRMADGLRVAETVTPGSVVTVSRLGARWAKATDVTTVHSTRPLTAEKRIATECGVSEVFAPRVRGGATGCCLHYATRSRAVERAAA